MQVVAWDADLPVGRGHVLFPGHEEWSISAHRWGCAEVRDVLVLPSHRRRGIATDVMAHLEEAAREQGWHRIGLTVGTDDEASPARALYDRLGYRFAHGPFIGSTTLLTDEGRKPVGGVFFYLTKGL